MQTESWVRSEADAWASRHFEETQRRIAAMVARILVEQVGVSFDAFATTTRLTEDLGMDELEPTQVVLSLEEELGISIPDDDCARLSTVADLVQYLHERTGTLRGTN